MNGVEIRTLCDSLFPSLRKHRFISKWLNYTAVFVRFLYFARRSVLSVNIRTYPLDRIHKIKLVRVGTPQVWYTCNSYIPP